MKIDRRTTLKLFAGAGTLLATSALPGQRADRNAATSRHSMRIRLRNAGTARFSDFIYRGLM